MHVCNCLLIEALDGAVDPTAVARYVPIATVIGIMPFLAALEAEYLI